MNWESLVNSLPMDQLPYVCVLGVLIVASFGVPIPEDIPLIVGGWLCHRGHAQVPIMIAVGLFGVLSGDLVLFTLGRRFGHHIVELRFVRRLVHPKRLFLAEALFRKHGIKILFAARFLPGLRSMIFVAAGVLKVPPWKFLCVVGTAAGISVPVWVLLGDYFGDDLDRLTRGVRTATLIAAAISLIVAIGLVTYLWQRRKERQLTAGTGPGRAAPDAFAGLSSGHNPGTADGAYAPNDAPPDSADLKSPSPGVPLPRDSDTPSASATGSRRN